MCPQVTLFREFGAKISLTNKKSVVSLLERHS